ncbi:MAG: hypothetical protein V4563_17750 [Pseudomonadota bacterium]
MFVVIKTNGASEIVIHVPASGAEKSLPAIAKMLEHNAVFIQDNWHETKLLEPEMTITLGSVYRPANSREDKAEIAISEAGTAISDDFVIATPEVMTSNKAALDKKDKELSRAKDELQITKKELEFAKEKLQVALAAADRLVRGDSEVEETA